MTFEQWLKTCLPHLRQVAAKYPLDCYRLIDTPGHILLRSYEEHKDGKTVTIALVHVSDRTVPGVRKAG